MSAGDTLQFVDIPFLSEVAQHPEDAPSARVKRGLGQHLIPAAHPVLNQQFLYIVHRRRRLGVLAIRAQPGAVGAGSP